MIFVDRTKVENPFQSDVEFAQKIDLEMQEAAAFFKTDQWKKRRFRFSGYQGGKVRRALEALFHNKCAFCETSIRTYELGAVEHYRPITSVVEAPDHQGYWWLANSWDNLLLVCTGCSQGWKKHQGYIGKGGRFPLFSVSLRAEKTGDELGERPLILDPTRDDPSEHLVFDSDGFVDGNTERGQVTIDIMNLNRSGLVLGRVDRLREFEKRYDIYYSSLNPESGLSLNEAEKALLKLQEISEPYSGLIQQTYEMYEQHIKELAAGLTQSVMELGGQENDANNLNYLGMAWTEKRRRDLIPDEDSSEHRIKRARIGSKSNTSQKSDYRLSDKESLDLFRYESHSLEEVSIRNLRAIDELELKFPVHLSGPMPWLVLLGENGRGKTTILQAIALTLSGPQYFASLIAEHRLQWDRMVKVGEEIGVVEVKVKGFVERHRLEIHRDKIVFKHPLDGEFEFVPREPVDFPYWRDSVVLLGYGATRLLPAGEHKPAEGNGFARIDNLFDPFVPTIDGRRWLLEQDTDRFMEAEEILRDLLGLSDDVEFQNSNETLELYVEGKLISIDHLSNGYQSIFAVTIDMLEMLYSVWDNPRNAEGIVLIDELGAHLHPRWQMRIVGSLRKAFPSVQFIASTHQPLCLRGLSASEVAVLAMDEEDNIVIVETIPAPETLRVEQLLTSDYFGLRSTTDPEIEKMFNSYYKLLAMLERTDEQNVEIKQLKNSLKGRVNLGDTERERLYYEVIDRILASNNSVPRRSIDSLAKDAHNEIELLWQSKVAQFKQEE